MIKVLGLFLACIASCVYLLMCIDREVARREYVAGVYPMKDCLFEFNCNHYNKLFKRAKTDVE